jgi:hypothetical protein
VGAFQSILHGNSRLPLFVMPKKHNEDNLFLFDPSEFRSTTPPPSVESVFKPKPITSDRIASLERTRITIGMMLDMGMNKDLVPALLSIDDALPLEQYRYLSGPISVHASGWSSTLEDASMRWLHTAIYKDRLEIVINELKTGKSDGLASASEVLAAMYPATLQAPMHHDWVQVYMWAWEATLSKHKYAQAMPQKADGTPYTDLWEWLGEKHPPTFDRIKQDYTHLASDIRQRVVKHAAERGVRLETKRRRSTEAVSTLPLFEES